MHIDFFSSQKNPKIFWKRMHSLLQKFLTTGELTLSIDNKVYHTFNWTKRVPNWSTKSYQITMKNKYK